MSDQIKIKQISKVKKASTTAFIFAIGIMLITAALVVPSIIKRNAKAASYTVTHLTDNAADGTCDGVDCSFRDAIEAAGSGDTINFGLSGTFALASGTGSGTLEIPSGVIVDASSEAVIIDGTLDVVDQVFLVNDDTTIRGFSGISGGTTASIHLKGDSLGTDVSSTGNTIQNNTLTGASLTGIRLVAGNGGVTSGNTVTGNTIMNAFNNIELTVTGTGKTRDNTISGNSIAGAGETNIVIDEAGSTNNTISGNDISGAGTGIGIYGGSYNTIGPDNSISIHTDGVRIDSGAKGNYIIGNVEGVDTQGINGNTTGITISYLASTSSETVISNNSVWGNTVAGVSIKNGEDLQLSKNDIHDNNVGLIGEGVLNLRLAEDTFTDNAVGDIQATTTGAEDFQAHAYNVDHNSVTTVDASKFQQAGQYYVSEMHNGTAGLTEVWGDVTASAENYTFNYSEPTFTETNGPIVKKAAEVTSLTVNNASSTTTEAWTLSYDQATGKWNVAGAVSGSQVTKLSSGVPYTTSSGTVITLQQSTPLEGSLAIVQGVKPSTDTNSQKNLHFNTVNVALNSGRSRMTVSGTGSVELKGSTTVPTIVSGDTYDMSIAGGTLDAQYFTMRDLSENGFQINNGSTITTLKNGTFQNNSAAGPHLSVDNIQNRTPLAPYEYLTFDNSALNDVKATTNADVLICESTRGAVLDNIEAGSKVTWCRYPEVTALNAVQRTDGSKIADLTLTAKDPDDQQVTVESLDYSTDNGSTWSAMTSPLKTTTFQATPTGTTQQSTWSVATNLPDTEATNIQIRATVKDPDVFSQTFTQTGKIVDTQNPRGLNFLRAKGSTETSIEWEWSEAIDANFLQYSLGYGTQQGGPYSASTTESQKTTTTKTVSSLTEGTIYYATLTAQDSFGNTASGTEASSATGRAQDAAIQVRTFNDTNKDGYWQASEGALKNKTIALTKDNGDKKLTTQDAAVSSSKTNRYGSVFFRGLQEGDYFATVTLAVGEKLTTSTSKTITATAGQQPVKLIGIATPETVQNIEVKTDKTEIKANGEDKAVITATLKDEQGDTVTEEYNVIFQTSQGELSSRVKETLNGSASIEIVSKTEGRLEVTAAVGSITGSTQVQASKEKEEETLLMLPVPENKNPAARSQTQTETTKAEAEKETPVWVEPVKAAATAATTTLAAIATLTALSSVNMLNIPIALWNLISNLMTIMGMKKPGKRWGTVYDSVSKEPLSLAVVRLIEKTTGKIKDTTITDATGRFGFILKKGTYQLEVSRRDYRFPSAIVSTGVDGKYQNVYSSQEITIEDESRQPMPMNVPLDSLLVSKAPKVYAIKKIWYKVVDILQLVNLPMLAVGFAASIILAILEPTVLAFVFIAIYTVLLAVKLIVTGAYHKPWGVVFQTQTEEVLPGAIVEIYDQESNTKKAAVVSDSIGRFQFLPSLGTYYLRILKPGYAHAGDYQAKNFKHIYREQETVTIANAKKAEIRKNIPMKRTEKATVPQPAALSSVEVLDHKGRPQPQGQVQPIRQQDHEDIELTIKKKRGARPTPQR